MDIPVYINDKKVCDIPNSYLIKLKRFCDKNGYRIKWKEENPGVEIMPVLNQKKKVIVHYGGSELEKEIVKGLMQLLRDEAVFTANNTNQSGYINLSIYVKNNHYSGTPVVRILYNFNNIKQYLKKHLDSFNLQHSFKRIEKAQANTLIVQLHLPALEMKHELKEMFQKKLSLSLASGLLDLFLEKREKDHAFPLEMLHLFHRNRSVHQSYFASENKSSSIKREKTIQDEPIHAEIYLDYTIYTSTEENENNTMIVTGDIFIKNIGTIDIKNPLICLKVDPVSNVTIGGQILPPEMAETMGVHSARGINGWKYVDENWFEKAKERGEYWITPISEYIIPAGERAKINDLQFLISRPKGQKMVGVKCYMYVAEQNKNIPSFNSIKIAF